MKIISGYLGGRYFKPPPGHKTHPLSEKARGGLFNALGDISGLRVLDTFAGSGALSYESVSRGAKTVTAVDSDVKASDVMKNNQQLLQIDNRLKIVRSNVRSWLNANNDLFFDIIFADPPHNKLQMDILLTLNEHLDKNGILIINLPSKTRPLNIANLKLVDTKVYGDTKLIFYSNKI